jgi:hypothetical protein
LNRFQKPMHVVATSPSGIEQSSCSLRILANRNEARWVATVTPAQNPEKRQRSRNDSPFENELPLLILAAESTYTVVC